MNGVTSLLARRITLISGLGGAVPFATFSFLAASLLPDQATAADLGGDCCADLEERIAELEATTARKGNRKVSLEVSGHVNEALLFWDDGDESNVYVVGNDSSRTRFRFKGKATITADWEAGYLLEVGIRSARSDRVDQGEPGPGTLVGDEPGATLDVRHSSWYIKSKTYGAITLGETSNATEDITEINLSQTQGLAKLADLEDYYAGFRLRSGSGAAGLSARRYGELFSDSDGDVPGEGDRGNFIRYESPEFAGFSASASWGEDDEWNAALRYKGEFNGIKIAAGIGYTENTEITSGSNAESDCATSPTSSGANNDAKCQSVGGSISVLHVPTGLFLSGAAGWEQDDNANNLFAANIEDDTSEFYAVQGGLERKFVELGKTTIYGEYFRYDGGTQDVAVAGGGVDPVLGPNGLGRTILSSEVEAFGVGVVQGIDAAALRLYVSYRHFETEVTAGNGAAQTELDLDDLDVVMTGALIQF